MSKEHPDDNAQSRFTAFWMIVAAFLAFIIVVSFALCWSSSEEDRVANVVEDKQAEYRKGKLADVMEDQHKLVNLASAAPDADNLVRIPVADGMKLVLPALQNKQAGPTELLVPGSPTQLKEAEAAAAAAKKKKDAEAKAKESEKKEDDKSDAETSEKSK